MDIKNDIKEYAKSINEQNISKLTIYLNMLADELYNSLLFEIANELNLQIQISDKLTQEEIDIFYCTNTALIKKIENNEIKADTKEHKILMKLLLQKAKSACAQFKSKTSLLA